MLFTSIVLILLCQITYVHSQDSNYDELEYEDASHPRKALRRPSVGDLDIDFRSPFGGDRDMGFRRPFVGDRDMDFRPPFVGDPNTDFRRPFERIVDKLNNIFPGRTFQFKDLLNMITGNKIDDNQCEFRFRPNVDDLFGNKLIIGQLNLINQIIAVQMSFHDENGNFIFNDDGNPIIYTSIHHQLGHVLDILHQNFPFSYIKCILKLKPNSNFDLYTLFFHFTHRSMLHDLRGTINGSNSFSIDSIGQMYNVSVDCPSDSTCMWLLDGAVISMTSNTSVVLVFESKNIGNRTLSYVAYTRNKPHVLASLLLSILPSTTHVCNTLPISSNNIWIVAGNMSSPRVYFTVTYLYQSEYVMIVGGTADNLNALSSVDIYDPISSCYNISNMTYARMKHAASYNSKRDAAFLIGGIGQGENLVRKSEFISLDGTKLHKSMVRARYSHEIARLDRWNILIAGGRGFNRTGQLERYQGAPSRFKKVGQYYQQLENLEGHSVTALGYTGFALIFGGYNGIEYSTLGLVTNGWSSRSSEEKEEEEEEEEEEVEEGGNGLELISARAYHQATYIRQINAVLITGGNNANETFSTSYLYNVNTKTFNATASMQQQRSYHAAVRISNGSVLIIGGAVTVNNNQPSNPTSSVERYDFATQTFTPVASLNVARYGHRAIYLPVTNQVFVFGGIDTDDNILSSFEFIKL